MAQASFRDPGGRVVIRDGRVLREVTPAGLPHLDAALSSDAVRAEIERGRFVRTEVLSRESGALLQHERIPFASFPYEWPSEMLHEAGALTIGLALALAAESRGIKDATPFNVLFRGPTPVFVDLLSIEQRHPADPLWLARAQFIRTFLLPLAAERAFGIPIAQSLLQRDGIEPEAFYPLLSASARLSPKYLSLVSMPVWLGRKKSAGAAMYDAKKESDPEKAAFILRSSLTSLQKSLARFAPAHRRESHWSAYMAGTCNYSAEQFQEKEKFVADALKEFAPKSVLDVGANTGHFSALAARAGASVVAIDSDTAVAGDIWRNARADNLDILPLVVNLAQPTPATGWRNRECPSFLDRAASGFDVVMFLAVIHHMLATERVPLSEIVDLAADLTRDLAIIEFVDFEDSMFRILSRGRDELYRHFHAPLFEQAVAARFDIVRKREISGGKRTLYLLRKK